jgi:hypothetical protein
VTTLVFICAGCGRFGGFEVGEAEGEPFNCPHCGNSDIDWVSRPDISNGSDPIVQLERAVLEKLNRAYAALDKGNTKLLETMIGGET